MRTALSRIHGQEVDTHLLAAGEAAGCGLGAIHGVENACCGDDVTLPHSDLFRQEAHALQLVVERILSGDIPHLHPAT